MQLIERVFFSSFALKQSQYSKRCNKQHLIGGSAYSSLRDDKHHLINLWMMALNWVPVLAAAMGCNKWEHKAQALGNGAMQYMINPLHRRI